ncbi:MAG: hypothetical protein SVW57_07740 [Thermodesulfobacteriota bacterium]|nr:hypothetical protein [Thermodesulfobacteriota bacterium]
MLNTNTIYTMKCNMKLISIIIAASLTFIMSGTLSSSGIHKKGIEIRVHAIGSFGQLRDTDTHVYLVTEKDFKSYQETKQFDLKPKGIPPLTFKNIKPGLYYVGVEIIIDKNVIKPELYHVTSPFPSQSIRLVPEKYFANDVPSQSEYGIKVVVVNGIESAEYYFVKWYSVYVDEEKIYPIVSLFLNKESSLSDWAQFYPQNEQFEISTTKKELETFWNVLDEFGVKTSLDQRNQTIHLLKRGGIVCLPSELRFKAIFVNSNGKILAKAQLKNSHEIELFEPITPKKQLRNEIIASDSSFNGEGKRLLPTFRLMLNGNNEVRIKNPNDFIVFAGVRSGNSGKDFKITAHNVASIFVPNGNYDIFFVYSDRPNELYQGESFSLNDNGIEIQIVKVVGGNYCIRRVKQK